MRSIISWLLDRGCFGGWVEMGYFEVEEGLVCEAAGMGFYFYCYLVLDFFGF
jgi:hypothetical protein